MDRNALQNINIGKVSISRSKALIFILYGLVFLFYISGLHQQLDVSYENRIKFHAVPIAISTLYQGHKHDYRGWRSTEIPFQNDILLTDEFLAKQIKAPVDKDQGHYYWVADDRGYADYVIAAFALFGPHMRSLYDFWFVLLLLSITFFVQAFGRQVWPLAFLSLLVLGIHFASALLKLIQIPIGIYEPRYLDALALIPVFHMIFAASFFQKEDLKKHFFCLFGQLFIFTFLYHARSSLGWEIVAVIGISLSVLFVRKRKNAVFPLLVITMLIASLMLLTGYKRQTYHKNYFEEMGVRTFWHNALMGLNKVLPEFDVDDVVIAHLVIQYAKESKICESCVEKLAAQELLNTLGNWGRADWLAYEKCAKKLYFSLLHQNKWKILQMYLFHKPLRVLIELRSPKGVLYSGKTFLTSGENARRNPLHLLYLIPLGLILFFSIQSLHLYRWKLLAITLAVFFAGMIPSIAFYTDILTRGGLSVTMVILLYLGIAICLFSAYKWVVKMIYPHRVNAYETQ